MTKYWIILALLLPLSLPAREKELKSTVKKGENAKGFFEAEFKYPQTESSIGHWCAQNGYVLLETKEGTIVRFGDYQSGVLKATFMEKGEYDRLIAEYNRQQAELRRQQDEDTFVGLLLVLGASAAAWNAISDATTPAPGSYSERRQPKEPDDYQISLETKCDVDLSMTEDAQFYLKIQLEEICKEPTSIWVKVTDANKKEYLLTSLESISDFNSKSRPFLPLPVSISIRYDGGCELTCPYEHCREKREADLKIKTKGSWVVKVK